MVGCDDRLTSRAAYARACTAPFARFVFRILFALACALALFGWTSRPAHAANRIEVVRASLDYHDEGWYVNAEFAFTLNPRLEEALIHGLPLYFKAEVELTRPRWYWADERTVVAEVNWRLSYHALTRQYRLSRGSLQLGYPTLDEALGVISRIHDWHVLETTTLKPGDRFRAAIRLQFDSSQLPKPFQINALTSREWTLESEWRRLDVTVEPGK
jgi:hypothetical protein